MIGNGEAEPAAADSSRDGPSRPRGGRVAIVDIPDHVGGSVAGRFADHGIEIAVTVDVVQYDPVGSVRKPDCVDGVCGPATVGVLQPCLAEMEVDVAVAVDVAAGDGLAEGGGRDLRPRPRGRGRIGRDFGFFGSERGVRVG
jgi:hypothetical protein